MSPVEVNTGEIIKEALVKAGVRESTIELPTLPPTDGKPKGAVMGARLEAQIAPIPTDGSKPAPVDTTIPKVAITEPVLTKSDINAIMEQTLRRFQSITDKRIAQIQVQFQPLTESVNKLIQSQEETQFALLPEEEQYKARIKRLEKQVNQTVQVQPQTTVQPSDQAQTQFYQNLVDMVDIAGLQIDDKRIDWAPDAQDFQIGFTRFKTSVKNATLEDQKKATEAVKTEMESEIKKLRKKTGIDKVGSSGASGSGDPDVEKLSPFEKLKLGFQIEQENNLK